MWCIFCLAVIPVIENITQPRDTLLGQSVAIFCLATGHPIPVITWQQNGVNIVGQGRVFTFFPQYENGRITFEGDDFVEGSMRANISDMLQTMYSDFSMVMSDLGVASALSIDSSARGDTGRYTCTATNQLPETRVFSMTSSAALLVVLGRGNKAAERIYMSAEESIIKPV